MNQGSFCILHDSLGYYKFWKKYNLKKLDIYKTNPDRAVS